jgi:serine protease Do
MYLYEPYFVAIEVFKVKIKLLLLSALLISILLGSTGCVYFQLEETPATLTVTTPAPINPDYVPPVADTSVVVPVIPDFASLVAEVRASVVAIDVTVNNFDILNGVIPLEGAGSGWIIDSSGLIVTNNHIVKGADTINVTLDNGHSYLATVVRTDEVADLAVIKINAPDLQAAAIGSSSRLRVGEWVMAMGNSLGQGLSATKGIVSNLEVSLQIDIGETLYNLVQTDAAINPGNSGGPLFNLAGQVVGITSAKVSQIGVEGTGYAISIDEAMPIITDLIKTGYYSRPWMGTGLYSVDQIVVTRYNLSVDRGVLITSVVADSPADAAGLKAGDVIISIDAKTVDSVSDLNEYLHNSRIGQTVTLKYYRGSEAYQVALTLSASPPA